jgi:hypothetical protein
MNTILLLALASALFPIAAPQLAAAPPTRVIPSADLQTDLAVLRQAYEELHPGLYRYSGKAEMGKKFEALSKQFRRDLSLPDAYLALSAFAAQVKCGHTYPNFFKQSKEIVDALFRGQNRVPFYFRWLKGQMVVTRDFTPGHVQPRGTKVLSINGTPVRSIMTRLMTIARARTDRTMPSVSPIWR